MNAGIEQKVTTQDQTDHSELSERRLWAAVLLQAVEDWRSGNFRERTEAQKFFFGNSSDFTTVCRGAGFEPDYVIRKIKNMGITVRRPAETIFAKVSYAQSAAHAA
jgi:hypothetical protein